MRSVETTGKTVEEAKHKAVRELNVPEEDIEFEVLEVGAKGLFGLLGGAPARVRATYYEVKRHRLSSTQASPRVGSPISEEDEADDRPSRGRRRGGGRTSDSGRGDSRGRGRSDGRSSTSREGRSAGRSGGERPSEERPAQPESRQSEGRGRNDRAPQRSEKATPRRTTPDHTQTSTSPASSDSGSGRSAQAGGRGARSPRAPRETGGRTGARESGQTSERRPGGRNPGEGREPDQQAAPGRQVSAPRSSATERTPEQPRQRTGADKVEMEARADEALALVSRILDAGELGARAHISSASNGNSPDGIDIDIEGGESAVLIGRQGQCLDALQFLVGIIVNRRNESKVRITLDADGFRRKHKETLEATALDLAGQVVEHNQEAELEPLPARDRLIIHNVLKGHPGVYTYSEGEGDDRHVIISPKEPEEA